MGADQNVTKCLCSCADGCITDFFWNNPIAVPRELGFVPAEHGMGGMRMSKAL